MTFLERMLGVSNASPNDDADAIIDRLVKSTDHRLVFVNRYRETLRKPVLAAHVRMRDLVARIPGPVEVSLKSWSADDTVRALFATGTDAPAALSNDEGVRMFFMQHPSSDCIAMLGFEIRERRVLAAAMYGECVQAETVRTTVSFAEPRILAPGTEEAHVRRELAMQGLEYLALRALERVGAKRLQRQNLEIERELLTAQLRLAIHRGVGFGGMGRPLLSKAQLEQDLEHTVRELEAASSSALLPELLAEIIEVLERSRELIALEPCGFALDAMNFKVDASEPHAVRPRIGILVLGEELRVGVLIARFPRSELTARSFADARFI